MARVVLREHYLPIVGALILQLLKRAIAFHLWGILRVREAVIVTGLPITNADKLSILGWKVNIYFRGATEQRTRRKR